LEPGEEQTKRGAPPRRVARPPHFQGSEVKSLPGSSQPHCGGGGIAIPEEGLGVGIPGLRKHCTGHGRRHAFRVFTKESRGRGSNRDAISASTERPGHPQRWGVLPFYQRGKEHTSSKSVSFYAARPSPYLTGLHPGEPYEKGYLNSCDHRQEPKGLVRSALEVREYNNGCTLSGD
jgi:hypothetical protein